MTSLLEIQEIIQRIGKRQARRWCRMPSVIFEADDFINEAMLHAPQWHKAFDPQRQTISTYVVARTYYLFIDICRRQSSHRACNFTSRTGAQIQSISAETKMHSYAGRGGDKKPMLRDILPAPSQASNERFYELLQGLSKTERLIVIMRYAEDQQQHHIARQLGMSESNVSLILKRVHVQIAATIERERAA